MDEPIVFPNVYTTRKGHVAYDQAERLRIAVAFDDLDDFLLAIRHPDFDKNRPMIDNLGVFYCDAIRITTAVLDGKTKGIYDFQDILGGDISPNHRNLSPIYLAAGLAAPKLTNYFIQRGDSVDARCDVPVLNLEDAPPIDLALESIQSMLFFGWTAVNGNDKLWTPSSSIIRLLIDVCQDNRRALEVVRLLVQNTQNKERVRQQFISYANNGKLVQLTALFLAAPDLFLPSTFLSLRDGLPSLEKRTSIQEGLSLLLDVFAAVGDKFVAYIRVEDPIGKREKIIAFLLREVAYQKPGVSSRDDYFLRFFKPVDELSSPHMPKLHENITLPNISKLSSQTGSIDINFNYVNRKYPSLKHKDAVVVYRAIRNKLSSMSRLHGLFLEIAIKSTERPNYLPKWFPTSSSRNFELALESFHNKAARTTPKIDSKLTLPKSLENKVMQPNFLLSLLKQSNLPRVFKRFIRF